jgi:RCC1 and BTB domain-containing protein
VPTNGSQLDGKNSKLFDDPKYSDMRIMVENNVIYVHKLVLRNRCHYFKTLFSETSFDRTKTSDEITEYYYDVYYVFLKYVYTHCIDIESETVLDLLVLANDYKEEELKLNCIDILISDTREENFCPFYFASVRYGFTEFENKYFEFVSIN